MKLTEINDALKAKQSAAEEEYLDSIGQWIKSFKPDAKAFEFEGYSEYNDEGGYDMNFSSLYIDDKSLEEIIGEMSKDDILKYFEVSKYYADDFKESNDPEEIWDMVRDNLSFDQCVYEYGKQEI
jgi:uncharacterized protein YlbG (UPF0298 family)